MKKHFSDKKGMTLIEVFVSAALIAVIVLSLFVVATQSAVFSRRIEQVYTATYIAQRRIDLLKRLGFDQIPSAAESDVRVGTDGNISGSGHYVRTTEVESDFGGNPSLIKIKITVQRLKINMDGSISDPVTYLGDPIIMETLYSNIE
ncbi:MAG: hypothetical protein ACE5JK_05690 [Candidatus Omnitrophota bacterium]